MLYHLPPFFPSSPAAYGGVLAAGFHGAQVKKSVDQTTANYSGIAAVAWDAEVFDTAAFHDAGDNTKLIIPASLNGYYVTVAAMVQADAVTANSSIDVTIFKNGALFDGAGSQMRSSGLGVDASANRAWTQCRSHVVQVSTGDYFEAMLHCSDTSITVTAANSFFELYVVGSSVEGALVKLSGDLTTQNLNTAALAFAAEVYDSDAFHDNVTANTRLTVPVAYNGRYAVVRGTMRLSQVTGGSTSHLQIKKGGVAFLSGAVQNQQNAAEITQYIDLETPPFVVSTGDLFELSAACSDTSTTVHVNGTFFSIEILPASFQGVSCILSGNLTANYTTSTAVAFAGADIYDTDAAHDPASNNTKIIVPAAWNGKYGVLTGVAFGTTDLTANNSVSVGIYKGGTSAYNGFGGFGGHNGTATLPFIMARSSIVLLTTGDEFTFQYWNSSDTSSTLAAAETTFSLRIIG